MSKFPYSHLFPGPELTVAISGQHVQVLESKTSHIRHSTVSNDVTRQKLVGSGSIRCAAVDQAFRYLVTTTDKVLRVWQLDGLQILSEREVPKKATCIRITHDAVNIIVSDKLGDIFRFPLLVPPEHCATASEGTGEDKPSIPPKTTSAELLMGHASLVTTFTLTADEKFIISADRDEHIRVSWYPEAHVIERFCLGHKKFVSALHIPPSDTTCLVSGGGDPMLKIWDWMSGKLELELDVHEAVMPFVKVKPSRRKRRSEGDDDGEDDDVSARQRRKEQKKSKKSRANADQERADGDVEPETVGEGEVDAMAVDLAESSEPPTEPILALHKIDSLESTHERLLIFNAVGATALFYCTFPTTSLPSPEIRHINFDVPVIDFVIAPEGEVIVFLDGNWGLVDGELSTANSRSMIRSLKLSDSQLVDSNAHDHSALLTTLNSAALLDATPEELSTLDIYTALNTLPKWVSNSQEDGTSEATGDGKGKGSAPSNLKVLGRMKRKQAMLAAAAASPLQGAEALEDGGDDAAGSSVETRGAKKPRSDATSPGGHKMEVDGAD